MEKLKLTKEDLQVIDEALDYINKYPDEDERPEPEFDVLIGDLFFLGLKMVQMIGEQ